MCIKCTRNKKFLKYSKETRFPTENMIVPLRITSASSLAYAVMEHLQTTNSTFSERKINEFP